MGRRYHLLHWPRMWLLCVCFATVGYVSSCGYHVVGPTASIQGTSRALSVEPFTNLTRIPMLEIRTAHALRQSILESQAFSLVQSIQAQQYIQGTVQQFRQVPISFDPQDNAQQYRIEVDILLRLMRSASRIPFFEQKITAWAEYLVSTSGDVRETAVARETAMFRLAQQFASKSVSLLTAVMN